MATTTKARKCRECKNPTLSPDGLCHLHTGAAISRAPMAPAAPPPPPADAAPGLDPDAAGAIGVALGSRQAVVAAVIAAAGSHLAAGTRPQVDSTLGARLRAMTSDPAVIAALSVTTGRSREAVSEQMALVAQALVPPEAIGAREASSLAHEYDRLRAEMEEHAAPREKRMGEIKARLRASVGLGTQAGHNDYGGVRVALTPVRVFDAALAAGALDEAQVESISVTKMDPTLAAKRLDKATYEQCRRAGTTRVDISRIED